MERVFPFSSLTLPFPESKPPKVTIAEELVFAAVVRPRSWKETVSHILRYRRYSNRRLTFAS